MNYCQTYTDYDRKNKEMEDVGPLQCTDIVTPDTGHVVQVMF